MKEAIAALVFLISSLTWFLPVTADAEGLCTTNTGELYINPVVQKNPSWCWVASSKAIFDYFKIWDRTEWPNTKPYDQCSLYNRAKNVGIDCCATPTNSSCAQTGWPDYVFNAFGWNDENNYRRRGAALSWDEVKKEICPNGKHGRPFIYVIQWPNQVGNPHTAIVKGYDDSEQPPLITIDWHYPVGEGKIDGIELIDYECEYHHDCVNGGTSPNFWWNQGGYDQISPPPSAPEPPSALRVQ